MTNTHQTYIAIDFPILSGSTGFLLTLSAAEMEPRGVPITADVGCCVANNSESASDFFFNSGK